MAHQDPLKLQPILKQVLQAYGFDVANVQAIPFGTGLINHTWKITDGDNGYILQRINQAVFNDPWAISHNLKLLGDHLAKHCPAYFFVGPLVANNGQTMVATSDGPFRMFPFVKGSHTKTVVETAGQAFEAAAQFGRFAKSLSGLDAARLKITLPRFHDLSFRYKQFLKALETGNAGRVKEAQWQIDALMAQAAIVEQYEQIKKDAGFKLRAMHHDTKISNVLFDANDKGICIIDLDTVMPGYFFSDVGDMMRTYLSGAGEEEKDITKITVRNDFYAAIVAGYRSEMREELTGTENQHFFYAGQFMIYMQALRFLTDHLTDDRYYGAAYEGHNLVRATNQIVLLQRLLEKKTVLVNV